MASSKHVLISKIHKWVGLLIVIQMLFWTVGGVVMSWIPIETVRGEHNRWSHSSQYLITEKAVELLNRYPGLELASLRTRTVADKPVVDVKFKGKPTEVLWLSDFSSVSVDEKMAVEIAKADFTAETGNIVAALLTVEPGDYRRGLPVWQVMMDDADDTRIYVNPKSGRVMSHRNAYWRFYDFFWMLHIMDYDERDDFNNPLLMVFALTAALFSVTGLFMIYYRFHRRDFGLKRKKVN
ncbi:PepSY domain-containing protein [Kordiimonas laminariae]|uniref:PepSY domain-containing protein n=1 Tax=Kordiimonas laminariae TaxID=2917717 RepID=UPI001FF2DD98|nr:PepSY domain-containing protein [Kordiimonas laminariae]MCK0068902.1 PepSY domain-containing protein [Kordiimonas laminariae]